jgi:hypothetical protein
MTVRGKYEIPSQGLSLDRTVYYKDDKFLYDAALPDGTHYQEGFDGTVAWQLHPKKGPAISEGNEIKSKARDADMHYPGHILDYFSSMTVVDVTNFEGHTCYHLKGTNKWGIVNEQFFDATTGLLVGYKFNSAWRGGSGDESEVFSDYKDFNGWLRPTLDTHKSWKPPPRLASTMSTPRYSRCLMPSKRCSPRKLRRGLEAPKPLICPLYPRLSSVFPQCPCHNPPTAPRPSPLPSSNISPLNKIRTYLSTVISGVDKNS